MIADLGGPGGTEAGAAPIFEADFVLSYGFRPRLRAQHAIANIHRLDTQSYHWVLDADIEACIDSIDHAALWAWCVDG